MAKGITKAPLPWFGSDAGVARELGGLFDGIRHVTIPFAGGMSILPFLKASNIVASDLHAAAIHFYRVASGQLGQATQQELFDRCATTLSHPTELVLARWREHGPDNAQAAWAFWAICWLSRKGKGGCESAATESDKTSVRYTPSGGSNASRLKAAAADLRRWAEEFRRCEWVCDDFRKVLASVADRPDCGVYVDPPWYGAGIAYKHKFSDADHRELRTLLTRFAQTRVVVRYGDCPEVRDLYRDGWEIVQRSSRSQANGEVAELWFVRNGARHDQD